MKPHSTRRFNKLVAIITLFCMATQTTFAALLNLSTGPLFIGAAVPPMVMLNVPKDHQMFTKLYNDYSDVNGDGVIDTTYTHSIDYYGYFDPFKCYVYAAGRFDPSENSPTKYCTGKWSGNFLNWVAMSRLDAVRKLLYGGFRNQDSDGLTVLERATITTDGHAWAKHYRGADLPQLVPFSVATAEVSLPSASTVTIALTQPTLGVISINRGGCGPNCTDTATVTTAAPHGLATGMTVTMAGATGTNAANYNKSTIITVTGASTFTYPVTVSANNPSDPAAGGPFSYRPEPIFTITQPATGRTFLRGDMIRAVFDANNFIEGAITYISSTANGAASTIELAFPHKAVGAGAQSAWTLANRSSPGITVCNTTNPGTTFASHSNVNTSNYPPTTTYAPLMRIAAGDYSLWAVSDGKMCQWSGNQNGNNASESEILASSLSPVQATVGITFGGAGPDYNVRVRVCDPALLGSEKCRLYENGNWKPIGLLQQYSSGDSKLIQFGLMTPSYSRNQSGGVLRKQVSFLDARPAVGGPGHTPYTPAAEDELNPTTGIFRDTNGIIKTLNSIQLHGYNFTSGATAATKYDQNSDGCNTPGLVFPGNDKCTSWGNPTSEMYIETLRYLAGKAVDTAFTPTPPGAGSYGTGGLTKDNVMNLRVRGWTAPVTSSNYCAPLNVIVMNASVSSYDNDEGQDDIFSPAAQVGDPTTSKAWTKLVGDQEGFTAATKIMIGSAAAAITAAPAGNDVSGLGLCTPKDLSGVDGLGDVSGICPEAPMLSGSYRLAGAAHWARERRIMPNLTKTNGDPIPATDFQSLRVNTYGITLSGSAPRIRLKVPGTASTFITVLPSGRTLNPNYVGTGSIMDFKVVRQNAKAHDDPANDAAYQAVNGPTGTGKFFVSWEDSLQGNDYDLDSWGVIGYQFGNIVGGVFTPCDGAGGPCTKIRVATDVIYGQAGFSLGFGFVVSGVTGGTIDATGATTYGDGAHYVSAHRGGNPAGAGGPVFNWPPAAATIGGVALALGAECNNCQQMDGPRSITFDVAVGGTGNVLLEDPLYYAAKYGNYKDFNKNGVRDVGEWDSKIAGVPDNFFLVTDPNKLEDALEASFISILSRATASSVATNSTSLQTGTTIYQARFNPADWSGQVLAFPVQLDGTIDAAPAWDAGDWLKTPTSTPPPVGPTLHWDTGRQIITIDNQAGVRTGVPFRLATVPPDVVNNLNIDPATLANDARAQERLDYLRGRDSNEGATPTAFRPRPVTKLGDIVNSNPNFVAAPNAGFADSSYVAFRNTHINRKPMIYVGGNDGMVHAFSANETGKELLAYVPSKVFPHLNRLTDKAYQHRYYVDGSPEVGDAEFAVGGTTAWRTVLVGTLGAGGQGLFALDITNPTNFTEANAASLVLWEFNDGDDPNLGYVMGQPVIRKMHSNTHPKGRWAVIVPGGYNNSEGTTPANLPVAGENACSNSTANPPVPPGCTTSTTGRGYLYIIYLDGPTGAGKTWVRGTDYIRLATGVGTVSTPNGLASPLAADVDADGRVDYIYAGDLQGNLFKWNVSNPDHAEWTNTANRVILHSATTGGGAPQAQPITSKVEGTLHPGGTGFILTFGTGKYLEPSDPTAPYSKQTFYGIWDMNNGATTSVQTVVSNRNQMLEQTITQPVGSPFRIVTDLVPNWSQDLVAPIASDTGGTPPDNKHLGWFMDFPDSATSGERAVFRPILTAGRLIFTTLIPNALACESGGTSFLMIIDPTTGGRIDAAVLDVGGDGQLNAADKIDPGTGLVFVSGVQSTIGITPTPTIIKVENTAPPPPGTGPGCAILGTCGATVAGSGFQLAFALAAGSSGGNASTMIGLGASGGRVSWRELMAQ